MQSIKQTVLAALKQYKGDNLYRAESAFEHKSQRELNEEYGQSGRTCRQILEEYRKREESVNNAIIWASTL